MSKVLAMITFLDQSGRPVDPGFGGGLPAGGGPVDPGFGGGLPSGGGPVDPGFGVGLPPVVDNGLPSSPGHPDQGLPPTYPVKPDQGLPSAPGIWPKPPAGIWPPPAPIYPSHPIYPTDPIEGAPSHPIALPPGSVWPPLPPEVSGKILAFCWLVGIGYRWVVLDPSLKPGFPDQGLPSGGHVSGQPIPGGERPSHQPGQTPEPKR